MEDSQMTAALKGLTKSLEEKHIANSTSLKEMNRKLEEVLAGFPEGDPASHRKYHEALIKKAESKAQMYQEITADVIKKGLWIGLAGIAAILFKYFVAWVRGGV